MEENKNTTIKAEQQNNVLFQDACQIIEQAQESAYRQVNETLIKRNWLLGLRIQHEVLKDKRAEYGEQVVKKLAQSLVERFGKGFQVANLYHFIAFYNYHPDIFYAVSRKSVDGNIENIFHAVSRKSENILNSLRSKSSIRLNWTHYRIILQEKNKEARDWYEQEAVRECTADCSATLRLSKNRPYCALS